MRLFTKWMGRLWRLVVLARRRILGLPSLFEHGSSAGDAGAAPTPPRGPAPRTGRGRSRKTASGRSYIERFKRPAVGARNPVIEQLRRRAVNELFDWLGLVIIPRQTWPILERVGDPGAAMEQLIVSLGCDSNRVRRHDPDEIARLSAAIDVLVALDVLRPHLSSAHLQELEYLLFSGDYKTVNIYSCIVSALSAILIGRDRSATLRVFAVYGDFIIHVERYIRDPLSLDPHDADEALQLSDGFIAAMENYAVLYEGVSAMIGAILAAWPDDLASGHDFDLRSGMILRFEEIDDALLTDAALGLAQVETLIEECSRLLQDLDELFHRICGASEPGDGPGRVSERDAALAFFGFAAGATPSWDEVRKAYNVVMKKVHPDLAAGVSDPVEIARRVAIAKQANIYRDLLRRRCGDAA